jgi:two-component system sensor kinase FixL
LPGRGFVDLLDRVYATGEPFQGRCIPVTLPAADGQASSVRFANFVYEAIRGEDGDVVGIFCEGFDVTEEKLAQDQVRSLQMELIHVSRASAMGAMASTLAHELNQPLAAISSYASAALRLAGEGEGSAAELQACLEGIRAASLRAGNIIRSVRGFSRRRSAVEEQGDLGAMVREAVDLALIGSAPSTPVLTCHIEDGLMVRADTVQIQQVVVNLVRNALDAMADRERKLLDVSVSRTGQAALVRVTDSGTGLDPVALDGLFDAFQTTKPDGLGLGLSISRTIIETHGGSIWASNRDGGGATFCFELPLLKDLAHLQLGIAAE